MHLCVSRAHTVHCKYKQMTSTTLYYLHTGEDICKKELETEESKLLEREQGAGCGAGGGAGGGSRELLRPRTRWQKVKKFGKTYGKHKIDTGLFIKFI